MLRGKKLETKNIVEQLGLPTHDVTNKKRM